ncbi:MAG: hypothetical protein FJ150_02785 [Euryarchaeota archaeon]|nr:hypothetical protein [Euryarchaeota archaeon]
MNNSILPKKYIAKKLIENTQVDNPQSITKVMKAAGLIEVPKKQLTNHLKYNYLPQLKEALANKNLTAQDIKEELKTRYADIYDIAMDSNVSKRNLALDIALYALRDIGKIYNVIKEVNFMQMQNTIVVERAEKNENKTETISG